MALKVTTAAGGQWKVVDVDDDDELLARQFGAQTEP